MTQFKAGDVVFGKFPKQDGMVLDHYSVVLMANNEGVVLVYTTSLKELTNCPQKFSSEDMKLANWTKACRYDAGTVCVVPNNAVRATGRISKATLAAIQKAYQRAVATRNVSCAMLSPQGEAVPA